MSNTNRKQLAEMVANENFNHMIIYKMFINTGVEDIFVKIDNEILLEKAILSFNIRAKNTFYGVFYFLKRFCEVLEENNIKHTIKCNPDLIEFWEKVKISSEDKFLSHKRYLEILDDISLTNITKKEALKAIVMCSYEGLYNIKYKAMINLRRKHIKGNKIIFEDKEIEISEDLSRLLIALSHQEYNFLEDRKIELKGLYNDSCFKFAFRNENITEEEVYNAIASLVSREYKLKYKLRDICLSGIFYRMKNFCEESNIDFTFLLFKNQTNNDKTKFEDILKDITKNLLFEVDSKKIKGFFRERYLEFTGKET